MCDTLAAMKNWTKDGGVLFAKNSDRSPNEPHLVVHESPLDYKSGTDLKLTYLSIPQVEHTLESILCKPSWTWGAEMGVNSASVAIGNEAVFTRAKRGPAALTGMDLVRLALERASSASDAVDCITRLLEEYGQGGNCGFDHPFYYDNSFLIVDLREGYLLETSGKRWVVERFTDRRSISNRLSIGAGHSQRSGVEEGYDFARKLTEPVYTYFSGSRKRQNSTCSALALPGMDAVGMMNALRQHIAQDEDRVFTHGSVRSVCMHAGGLVGDHTTGSLVVSMREDKPATLWCTASSSPCISAFKPVFLSGSPQAPVFDIGEQSEAMRYWLAREAIHRGVLAGKVDAAAIRMRRNALEQSWLTEERHMFEPGASVPDTQTLTAFSQKAAQEEQAMVQEFTPKDGWKMPARGRFNRYWAIKNDALMQ